MTVTSLKLLISVNPVLRGSFTEISSQEIPEGSSREHLELVNSDDCSKMNPQSLSEADYFLTFIDDQGRRKIDNWSRGGGGGGHIFIYSCSQTVKTIDFKIIISISKPIYNIHYKFKLMEQC